MEYDDKYHTTMWFTAKETDYDARAAEKEIVRLLRLLSSTKGFAGFQGSLYGMRKDAGNRRRLPVPLIR